MVPWYIVTGLALIISIYIAFLALEKIF